MASRLAPRRLHVLHLPLSSVLSVIQAHCSAYPAKKEKGVGRLKGERGYSRARALEINVS